MSIKVMNWVWQQHVTQAQKLVLMALADHADDEGVCWPGVQGIAQKCNLSRRMVQYHLKALEGGHLLERVSRKREDGSQSSNLIRLALPEIAPRGAMDCTPPVQQLLHPSESPLESSYGGDEEIQDHHNLFSLFSEVEQQELREKYLSLDFEVESQKCVSWWLEGNKVMKRPRTAFLNWLDKAALIKAESNGRNNGRGMTPGAPPADRNEFLRDYERRRGLMA